MYSNTFWCRADQVPTPKYLNTSKNAAHVKVFPKKLNSFKSLC